MTPFIAGFIMGALFIGCGAILFLTRHKPRQHQPEPWTEEHYAAPVVKTRILVNRRNIEI